MLGSGITIVRAMELICDGTTKPKLLAVYEKLLKDVQQGFTLSEAMRLQPKSFPELLINMLASGEASGQMERVTAKMAVHYEKEHKLNSKVKSAMMYPMILSILLVVVVLAIFMIILPEFFETFENIELPLITKIMVAISDFLINRFYVFIVAVVAIVVLIMYLFTTKGFRLWFDKRKTKMRPIGKLMRTIYTARFSRTLSSLYSSGVTMITAIELTGTIIGNKYIAGQFDGIVKDVRNGAPLSESVRKVEGFDKKLASTLLIGEESGRLDTMLESIAETFDYDADVATDRLTRLIEPVMLIVMGVIIGFIMLSVIMPLMSLYQNAGGL
jgi:type IV pilus assembly protein PilC